MTKPLAHLPEDSYECDRQQSGQVHINGLQTMTQLFRPKCIATKLQA